MEQFAPHPSAMFEGYYSKFRLPSGSHIALIICTVPNATTHPPHMVSFTYYPSSPSPSNPIFQREHWVSSLSFEETGAGHAFKLSAPGLGSMSVDKDSTTTYDLECEEWSLHGTTTDRTPWNEGETPEGVLVRLPLPLHWHVHSLSSSCEFKLRIRDVELPREDQKGRASVHQEKNWASSFPESHMWVQASEVNGNGARRGVCLAGGKILGMTAYILGYRSPDLNVDFKPPFALAVFNLSPLMNVDVDWENRKFEISVAGLWKKIVIKAQAPKEKGWFGLGAPFKEGHLQNFCTESFSAVIEVEVSERAGWWPWCAWREIRRERFENGSLEFGGGYFPERGLKRE
jgi:tocopherol cyclase